MQINNLDIHSLSLENYKKHTSLTLKFEKKFMLIIGENGAGKTSILDALATLLGAYLQAFKNIPPADTHSFKKSDIHFEIESTLETLQSNYSKSVSVNGRFIINEKTSVEIQRRRDGYKTGRTKLPRLINKKLIKLVEELEEKPDNLIYPLLSYHGTGRLWEQNKQSSKMEHITRLDGYKDCLNAKSNYRNFISWFEKLERHAFNLRKEVPVLEAVRKSVILAISMLTLKEVEIFHYRESDLEIKFINSSRIERVSTMSDGYKNIIGIISDIAYRMAILNPSLGKEIIIKTPGIVLIDEIDLHLHPIWQKKIISILTTIFPKVQFIASSHSPFIIQSLGTESIIKLDASSEPLREDPLNMSIEDISEYIQKVDMPQLSTKKIEMLEAAEEYFTMLNLLEQGKATKETVQDIKNKLDDIAKRYDDNMAYVAFLQSKRLLSETKQ